MDGAIGATRQRLTQDLRGASRASRAHDDFPAVLLLHAQRFFEGVGVRFVQLEAGVLVADPCLGVIYAQLPLSCDDLLDTNGNLHNVTGSCFPAVALFGEALE